MKVHGIALAAALILSTTAFADTTPVQACSAGSLASYIAMGASGCSVGAVVLSRFSYSATATDHLNWTPVTPVGPEAVSVTVLNAPGNPGLAFGGKWRANDLLGHGAQSTTFKLNYTVTPLSSTSSLTGLTLELIYFGVSGSTAGVSIAANGCYVWASTGRGGPPAGNSSCQTSFSPTSSIALQNYAAVTDAALGKFSNQFQTSQLVVTPEPTSVLLYGTGIGLLGFLRRKLLSNRS